MVLSVCVKLNDIFEQGKGYRWIKRIGARDAARCGCGAMDLWVPCSMVLIRR